MIYCSRTFEFCYAHRLVDHAGKCATLHGHNALVELHATSLSHALNPIETDVLPPSGMVMDFSLLKNRVGGWIDNNWDHTVILSAHDTLTIKLSEVDK